MKPSSARQKLTVVYLFTTTVGCAPQMVRWLSRPNLQTPWWVDFCSAFSICGVLSMFCAGLFAFALKFSPTTDGPETNREEYQVIAFLAAMPVVFINLVIETQADAPAGILAIVCLLVCPIVAAAKIVTTRKNAARVPTP